MIAEFGDKVEPGRRGRCEVQVESRMLEPLRHGGGFMGGLVVDDEVKVETDRSLLIDQLEKVQEFTMPMAWHARPDDLAIQHVERREQDRGAVALVVAVMTAAVVSAVNPSLTRSPTRALQITFCVLRSRISRSNRSRSAMLTRICSIFLIGAGSRRFVNRLPVTEHSFRHRASRS
jgi:hypothetical protein